MLSTGYPALWEGQVAGGEGRGGGGGIVGGGSVTLAWFHHEKPPALEAPSTRADWDSGSPLAGTLCLWDNGSRCCLPHWLLGKCVLRSAQAECPGRLGPWLPGAGSGDRPQLLRIQHPGDAMPIPKYRVLCFSPPGKGAHAGGSQVVTSPALTLHRGGN